MNLLKIYISVDFPVPTGPANHKPFGYRAILVVSGNTETGNTRSLCFARQLRYCLWNSDLLPEETISYRPLRSILFSGVSVTGRWIVCLTSCTPCISFNFFRLKSICFAKLSQSVTCTPVPLRQPWNCSEKNNRPWFSQSGNKLPEKNFNTSSSTGGINSFLCPYWISFSAFLPEKANCFHGGL